MKEASEGGLAHARVAREHQVAARVQHLATAAALHELHLPEGEGEFNMTPLGA